MYTALFLISVADTGSHPACVWWLSNFSIAIGPIHFCGLRMGGLGWVPGVVYARKLENGPELSYKLRHAALKNRG